MGMDDDIKHNMEDMKGKAKEAVGDVTDNDRLKAEGHADQASANLKKAGQDVKDAFTDDR
ncbi:MULTISPECIES: CsbD family protein [Microbacterium]|uniref:CsbD family protein n=1 Tax=Microbacterium TaxID=33882 RepID=UPI001469F627|nr:MULTISPECIES: CsbD family protein [Microbacterium]